MSKFTSVQPAYSLADGNAKLNALQVSGGKNMLVAEMVDIDAGGASISVEQSIDGNAWGEIPDSSQVLSPGQTNHQWNIVNLLVSGAFVRVSVTKASAEAGIITSIKLLSDE